MLENCKRLICSPSLNKVYCIVLYCIVLYCIVLYCIVLYCIVLYWGTIIFYSALVIGYSKFQQSDWFPG